ncbi:MAG: transposase [Thomasclavelia sp.]
MERNLQWNPHIHILVCEDAYDTKNDKIKNFSFMSYKKLRQTWRYQLLDYLDKRIGNNETFRRLKLWYYTKYTEGFYVHAPKSKKIRMKTISMIALNISPGIPADRSWPKAG